MNDNTFAAGFQMAIEAVLEVIDSQQITRIAKIIDGHEIDELSEDYLHKWTLEKCIIKLLDQEVSE